jgi:two-component system, OmpR family, sensor kinase
MSERAWYRSLYWRIALGFILFLAAVIAVQAVLFLWIVARGEGSGFGPVDARRPIPNLANLVASDLSAALADEPPLELAEYVRERYDALRWPVVVVMRDGRVVTTRPAETPPGLIRMLAVRLRAGRVPAWEPVSRRSGFGPVAIAPVVVTGRTTGVVAVRLQRAPQAVLREYAPIMLLVGGGLLLAGTALAALFIFRPAHRRLRGLEEAARRLGGGEDNARAPEDGGDEISAVAHTFNRMAADLSARARQLEHADRARRQLLADVSHELMTPLTAIRGYLETLAMPGLPLDGATRDRYLAIIQQETLRLERLIGDLLDLSRLEAGGITLTVRRVPVRDVFERVVARHELASREKQIPLEIRIEDGIQDVDADPDRLEQALQNLVANALRYTPPGGRVQLRASLTNADLVLQVRDAGIGIPHLHLPLIFDRFYKVDAARTGTTSGSGLGLSIARAIAERHGGSIAARSEPGVETVFEIRLPRRTPPPSTT